jgi:NAD(P)-dependent dehydrogenase (short-subunit alcohol dehydrogenase family)
MPNVLITGANRGIGLEFARQYAAAGWNVIAAVRHSSAELDATGVQIETLDLADPDAIASFAESFDQALDLFIANAGVSEPKSPESADDIRAWQEMMLVNAIASYMLGRAVLSHMPRGAKLIAISSGMGSIADNSGGWVPYRASKAALNMAWNSLAIEARPQGVCAVTLSPGWVKTRMGGAGAEITTEESVTDLRRLIERLSLDESGKFLRRDGSPLDW